MLVSSFPMIDLFVQFLLALVFAGAAVSKLQNADEFHGVVRNFRLLPQAVDGAFAAALPWVELGIAASLILGVGIPASGALAGLLLFVFAVAIAINIFRGKRVGTIFGTISIGSGLGSAFGSVTGGAIHDWSHSYDLVILFALVNTLIGMIPFLTVRALRE